MSRATSKAGAPSGPAGRRIAVLLLAGLAGGPLALAQPRPGPTDKCPVCGMFVARYPDWIATATFTDGTTVFFDGPKDLFRFLDDPKQYLPSRSREAVRSLTVTDSYSVRPIPARSAVYVVGSDVFGPMGRELVPFEKEADALEFQRDHRGRTLVRFDQVTPELLRTLDGTP